MQGICTPHPRFIALPGSSVITDIPIPDDSGYAVLIPFLQQQSRAVQSVLGDGNCLFRALSIQLTGVQDHNLELRKAIALFEQRNETVFKRLHESIARSQSPFSDHIQNIKKSCTWGTTVEILAASSFFQVDVYVASDTYHQGKVSWIKYSPRVSPASLTVELKGFTLGSHLNMRNEWIEILHVSHSHFDAIKPQLLQILHGQLLWKLLFI